MLQMQLSSKSTHYVLLHWSLCMQMTRHFFSLTEFACNSNKYLLCIGEKYKSNDFEIVEAVWNGNIYNLHPLIPTVSKTVSLEFARKKDPITCILLHPGTVDTDLSKPFQRNIAPDKIFSKEFSVQKLLSIINNVKSHDNGKFFAWDGQEIPW